jgi:hypothetical protein
MLNLLLVVLPARLLVLGLIALGLAVVVGLVSLARAARLVFGLVGMALLAPVIAEVIASLPWWVGLLVRFLTVTWMVRAVLTFVLGREAAGHVLGHFAIHAIRLAARMALAPARSVLWLIRRTVA